MVGLDDGDVPEVPVSARLTFGIPGQPKIDSKALVMLGSGRVDAIPGVPLSPTGDEVPPVVCEGKGGGHLWGVRKKNGAVFDAGLGNGSPGSWVTVGRDFDHRRDFLVGVVIVQVSEEVGGVHDVGAPEVVVLFYIC